MSRRLREKAERLLSAETGAIHKPKGGRCSVCLVYPNTYYVGMSNLGFQGVYGMLNERDDTVCERAFLPDPEDVPEYERTGAELFSLESGTPLGRFDVVAFSVPFENDYPNVLKILRLSRIPIESSKRTGRYPLVAMGGACAMSNPEPMAEFMDLCFVGEAEGLLDEFMASFDRRKPRAVSLERAMSVEGVYAPSFYEVGYSGDGLIAERRPLRGAPEFIRRRFVKDPSGFRMRHVVTTPNTEFSDMALVEAMRGCPWNCRFCLAGHLFNPPRKKPLESLRAEIEAAGASARRVGLIGPSLSDYPHVKDALCMGGVDFSITSLRASRRSAEMVGLMKGKRSVSIAPEAGSQRLRDYINKNITEEDILSTSALILESGIRRLKLYFMVGLPTETEQDIEGIVVLVKKIRAARPNGEVVLTLSTFVPKPFTPFERTAMERMDAVKARLRLIRKSLAPLKGVRVFHDVPKYAYLQGMLSVGDRRVSGALKNMLDEPDWRKASEKAGVNPDFYTMREKGPEERLPWGFIAC